MSTFIEWSDLEIGKTYFLLGYHDLNKRFPKIETVVYAGTERDEAASRMLHMFKHPTEEDVEDWSFLDSDPSCVGDLDCLILELQDYKARYSEK